jgi:hypothetical protein
MDFLGNFSGNMEGCFLENPPSYFRYQHDDGLLYEKEIRASLPHYIPQSMLVI